MRGHEGGRLPLAAILALFTAGMAAALRANVAGDWQRLLFDSIDRPHAAGMVGAILGAAFLASAVTIAIGGALVDKIGMTLMLRMSGTCFIAGTLIMAFGRGLYCTLYAGAIVTGLGWGLAESAIIPLVVRLNPGEFVARLIELHAWWLAGLVAGGALGYGLVKLHAGWQAELALIVVPAAILVVLSRGIECPPAESPATRGNLLHPLFLLLCLAMSLAAASDLAAGQWLDFALSRAIHMQGILLLVYVSGVLFAARSLTRRLAHRPPSLGVVCGACLLASLGLAALGVADSQIPAAASATVWGAGVGIMFPAVLAVAADRLTGLGAPAILWIRAAGMLATGLVLPALGRICDAKRIQAASDVAILPLLSPARLIEVTGRASPISFGALAVLPLAALVVFLVLRLWPTSALPRS